MSYRIGLSLDIACEDSDAADDEMEQLSNYVGDRLNDGASMQRIVQAMVEALMELGGVDDMPASSSDTIH
tara:strand:- start:2116 stop:2325 length:210 start_codon:yes stop_codon:yes gene_type:complete